MKVALRTRPSHDRNGTLPQHSFDWIGTRTEAEQIACPVCHSAPGRTCRNLGTGRELKDQPAHYRRIQKAAEQ